MNVVRHNVFETPVWIFKYPNFQQHKLNLISAVQRVRELDKEGARISNVNGYQSNQNIDILNNNSYPEFNELFDIIGDVMVNQVVKDDEFVPCDVHIVTAWININHRRDAINVIHTHDCVYSGVFYLQVPPKSGSLAFFNSVLPGSWEGFRFKDDTKPKAISNNRMIGPLEGNILIWHSYLPHYVLPNDHDEERISIAFNIKCIKKKI